MLIWRTLLHRKINMDIQHIPDKIDILLQRCKEEIVAIFRKEGTGNINLRLDISDGGIRNAAIEVNKKTVIK